MYTNIYTYIYICKFDCFWAFSPASLRLVLLGLLPFIHILKLGLNYMFRSIKLLWSEHPGNIYVKPGNINSLPEGYMVLFTKKDLYSPWNIITNSDFYGDHLFAFIIYLFWPLHYTSVSTIEYFCLSLHHLLKESFSILFWSSSFVIKSVYIIYSCFPYPFPPSYFHYIDSSFFSLLSLQLGISYCF